MSVGVGSLALEIHRSPEGIPGKVIAIDGPAGAGKSTVARKVAEKLGFSYLDTGAMYRAVTLKALQEKVNFEDQTQLSLCARQAGIKFEERCGSSFPAVIMNGADVTEAIRDPEITRLVSHVAKDAKVRECMTQAQQQIGAQGKWVVDGRDIGTVVFPQAAVKIFLTASIRERAERRLKELTAKGFKTSTEALIEEIACRDGIDSTRAVAPLRQAEEAVYLDTTDLTIEQVVNRIIEIATTTKDAKIRMEERMEEVVKPAAQKVETDESKMTMEDLEREMSGEFRTIRNGAIVTGTIIDVTHTGVFVDLGYKTDGMIPQEEFDNESLKDFKVGEKIRVFVKSVDDGRGQLTLSHRRAKELDAWDVIQEAHTSHKPIEGILRERIKGGYNVDFHGIRAFLPQSQLSHGKNEKESIDKAFPMIVTEFDRRRKNVVVSERAVVEEMRNKRRGEILATHQPGDLIKGVVSRLVEYGAFIDLGDGVEGLIHRNDLSWSVISNPREVIQPGQEVEAKILKIDVEKGKIALGLKQKKEDPWITVDQRYEVSRKYQGKVKNLMDFGAFVELEEGVEGLVHISDLSWVRNVRHPGDIVKSGDVIQVLVKEIDKTKKRISLSYKDTLPHPWDNFETKFKVGDMVKGRVNNLTDFGAFVEITEGIEGLLHISDMDWVKKINHPKEVLEKGQEVTVKILNIDAQSRRLSLGLKQTTTDPWDQLDKLYKIGDVVTGVVKNLVSYGAFVQLENGLEGLLHISEFSWQSAVKDPAELVKVGDQVTVAIYELDKFKQKIGLSLRRVSGDPWKGIEKRFPTNSIQQGKIVAVENSGAEVELAENVRGFIHISQVAQVRVSHPSEAVKEGDTVTVKVLELDRKNRKLKLSIKEAVLDTEQRELKKFQQQSNEGFSDTIGDLLRNKLELLREHFKG